MILDTILVLLIIAGVTYALIYLIIKLVQLLKYLR